MSIAHQHLWTHILRGTTEGVSKVVIARELLGEAKVSKLNVAVNIKQYIFWFQVSVNDSF